jgi:hypothetical protein
LLSQGGESISIYDYLFTRDDDINIQKPEHWHSCPVCMSFPIGQLLQTPSKTYPLLVTMLILDEMVDSCEVYSTIAPNIRQNSTYGLVQEGTYLAGRPHAELILDHAPVRDHNQTMTDAPRNDNTSSLGTKRPRTSPAASPIIKSPDLNQGENLSSASSPSKAKRQRVNNTSSLPLQIEISIDLQQFATETEVDTPVRAPRLHIDSSMLAFC